MSNDLVLKIIFAAGSLKEYIYQYYACSGSLPRRKKNNFWRRLAFSSAHSALRFRYRVHSRIGVEPSQVTDAMAAKLRERAYRKGAKYLKVLNSITPGSLVRLYWKVDPEIPENQKAFCKLSNNWSRKVYKVEAIVGYRVKLEGLPKKYSLSDVQLVSEPEGNEAPGGISKVARKDKAKRAELLKEIDAAIPTQELSALTPKERQTRDNDDKEIVPMELRPKMRAKSNEKPELNEELAPVQKGDDLAVKVLDYEFREGKDKAGARWGLWFKVGYLSGTELWERVNPYLVPAYEILGNKKKKQVGWNVLAPVGAFWDKQRKKDAELNKIWTTDL